MLFVHDIQCCYYLFSVQSDDRPSALIVLQRHLQRGASYSRVAARTRLFERPSSSPRREDFPHSKMTRLEIRARRRTAAAHQRSL